MSSPFGFKNTDEFVDNIIRPARSGRFRLLAGVAACRRNIGPSGSDPAGQLGATSTLVMMPRETVSVALLKKALSQDRETLHGEIISPPLALRGL
jgi:hypothetical protein